MYKNSAFGCRNRHCQYSFIESPPVYHQRFCTIINILGDFLHLVKKQCYSLHYPCQEQDSDQKIVFGPQCAIDWQSKARRPGSKSRFRHDCHKVLSEAHVQAVNVDQCSVSPCNTIRLLLNSRYRNLQGYSIVE